MFFPRLVFFPVGSRLASALAQESTSLIQRSLPSANAKLVLGRRKAEAFAPNFVLLRSLFTTGKVFKETKEDQGLRLEKLRLDELSSAEKFQCQDSESASHLYEEDVAQNRSFSEADAKAGNVTPANYPTAKGSIVVL